MTKKTVLLLDKVTEAGTVLYAIDTTVTGTMGYSGTKVEPFTTVTCDAANHGWMSA